MLDKIRIVLVGTTHPGNIGAAARAMKSMGLSQLVLVSPKTFPAAEATAMASGADDLLANARVCDDLDEALAGCSRVFGASARIRSLRWPQGNPREAAEDLLAHLQGEAITVDAQQAGEGAGVADGVGLAGAVNAVAIVFGRENSGLANEEMDRCQALLHIPSNPAFHSLNLAASVQVVCYELRMRQLALQQQAEPVDDAVPGLSGELVGIAEGAPAGDSRKRLAHSDEFEGMLEHLQRALVHSEFLDPQDPRYLIRRLRRLFARTRLFIDEVHILRGIAHSILKLKRQ